MTPTTEQLERFADWCQTEAGQDDIRRFGWREGAHYCTNRRYAMATGYKVCSGNGPTLFEHWLCWELRRQTQLVANVRRAALMGCNELPKD